MDNHCLAKTLRKLGDADRKAKHEAASQADNIDTITIAFNVRDRPCAHIIDTDERRLREGGTRNLNDLRRGGASAKHEGENSDEREHITTHHGIL